MVNHLNIGHTNYDAWSAGAPLIVVSVDDNAEMNYGGSAVLISKVLVQKSTENDYATNVSS